jgi:hypothetical protein
LRRGPAFFSSELAGELRPIDQSKFSMANKKEYLLLIPQDHFWSVLLAVIVIERGSGGAKFRETPAKLYYVTACNQLKATLM